MARGYVKGKRAEQEAETRQRIVEAAMALHEEIGPATTTISMIAERAAVQRHTVYAHFADELSLFMACSGHHLELYPVPSPEAWAGIDDPAKRLTTALGAVYGWFAETEAMTAHVLRDAETNDTLRQVASQRFGVPLGAVYASLAAGLDARGKAALTLALSFYTWRSLNRDAGLSDKKAVALMVETILGAK